MEFDKSRVYTAVNADELEAGDIVFVADTLDDLQRIVTNASTTIKIKAVEASDEAYRFTVASSVSYMLAYLIAKHNDPYKEFKKAQAEGKDIWYKTIEGNWRHGHNYSFLDPIDRYSLTYPTKQYKVFLCDGRFMYTSLEVPDGAHVYYTSTSMQEASAWCMKHYKFADVAKAWEEGKQIQVKFSDTWYDTNNPKWETDNEYRIKPVILKWTDLNIGDVIKKDSITAMVTGIDASPQVDTESDMHIHICIGWLSDDDLTEWEIVR